MVSPALTQPSTDNAAPKANKNTQYVYVHVYDDDNDSDGEDNGDDGDDDEVNGKKCHLLLGIDLGQPHPAPQHAAKAFRDHHDDDHGDDHDDADDDHDDDDDHEKDFSKDDEVGSSEKLSKQSVQR